jgi:hypothetical protein
MNTARTTASVEGAGVAEVARLQLAGVSRRYLLTVGLRRLHLGLVTAMIAYFALLTVSRAQGPTANAKPRGVAPAKLEKWHIRIDFAGGAPNERSLNFTYEINISSDGSAKFENLRAAGKKPVTLFAGRLTKEELESCLQAAIAAIKGFDIAQGDSRGGDGWDVSLSLSAVKHSITQRAVQISICDVNTLREAGPKIASIIELLNKRVDAKQRIRLDRD